ncbi:hypothetical protein DRO55_03825 [Candidatus Bathyarchaeota archaeon]|nr:MAG: hypothetical protein DRO55_03825 [Candidatus Bathyarchaeota archaeon]
MRRIEFKRELGLFYGIIIGLNGAFGIEFFVLLEHAIFLAGPAVVLSLLLCGIITMLTLFSYCELGAAISRVGGEYTFAKVAFGGFTSFLTGWLRWISSVTTVALASIGLAQFISYFYPVNIPIVSVLAIVIFTFTSIRGVKKLDVLTVFSFIGIFTLLVTLGLYDQSKLVNLTSFSSIRTFMPKGVSGVLAGIMYTFSMFVGVRALIAGSTQIKNPEKNVPRAILLSIVILIVLYCLVAFIVVGVAPENYEGSEPILTYAAERIMGPIGGTLITIAGISAALMSLTTAMMVQRSIIYGLSRDGYFPRFIFSSERKFGRHLSVIIGSALAILLAASGLIVFIGYIAGFASLLVFALVNLSLIRLRRVMPRLSRPFKAPLYPYASIAGVVISLLLILFIERSALLIGFEFIVAAVIVYHLKMVGYHRLRLAVGGINLGIGGLTLFTLYLMRRGIITIDLPQGLRWTFPYLPAFIGAIFLLAGILNIAGRRRKEP